MNLLRTNDFTHRAATHRHAELVRSIFPRSIRLGARQRLQAGRWPHVRPERADLVEIGTCTGRNSPPLTTHFADDDLQQETGGFVSIRPIEVLDVGRSAIPAGSNCAPFRARQANQHIVSGVVNEHGALV